MTRGQHAVLIVAAVATAAVSPVSAQSVAPTIACVALPGFARFDTPLKRVAARISAHQPLTIVAIGSSSTVGLGASSPAMSYPSRLAVELRALLPRTSITVINRGVNGETARGMLARSIATCSQHTLTWCCGRSVAMQCYSGRPIAPTGLLIDEGVRRLKVAGSDVVLIDPQYAPKVIAKHDEHDVDLMVALISTASRDMHVNLFQRYALCAMRYWRLTKGFPFSAVLSKDDRRPRTVFPPHVHEFPRLSARGVRPQALRSTSAKRESCAARFRA